MPLTFLLPLLLAQAAPFDLDNPYASALPRRMQPRIEKKRYASQLSSQGFESLNELHNELTPN